MFSAGADVLAAPGDIKLQAQQLQEAGVLEAHIQTRDYSHMASSQHAPSVMVVQSSEDDTPMA